MKISKIFLYDEPAIPEIGFSRLRDFLKQTFDVQVEQRKNIFQSANDSIASEIAASRIFKTRQPFEKHEPTTEEVSFEKASFLDSTKTENIVMYDGFEFHKAVTKLIPENEMTSDQFHIIFTNKFTCTYDQADFRYHGRALIASNPSIISTTGIIEAPAKPKAYYFELISNMTQGLNLESIKKKYQGMYLEYHDAKLSQVVEGYLLQAIFYYLTGDPFCDKRECRLFNAHWQKDLLYSQLEIAKLCDKHQEILNNW